MALPLFRLLKSIINLHLGHSLCVLQSWWFWGESFTINGLLLCLWAHSTWGGGVGQRIRHILFIMELRIVANLIVPSANNYHGPTLQLDCEPLLDYRLFHCISTGALRPALLLCPKERVLGRLLQINT